MNFLKNLASDLLDDQEQFTNLTQVAVVDVDACASVLNKRYAKDSIYTHCGPLLVAVNPYDVFPELYSAEMLEEHLELVPAEPRLPHVFDMAARVYSELMASGQDQAVIISGESGAGKTENAKFMLRFFAEAACSAGDGLHDRVMGTNPVMESFGCAQTIRNDNSSRFGKFVQLQFTTTGRLAEARVETYLLEKSRVVTLSAGECNFHIFHEALVGLDASQVAAYRAPGSASACAYLRAADEEGGARSEEKDAAHFQQTTGAFNAIGVDESAQTSVMQLLVAILHLGNVDFGGADEAAIDDHSSWASLEAACALLQAPKPDTLAPLRSPPLLSAPLRSSPLLSAPLRSPPLLSAPLRSSPLPFLLASCPRLAHRPRLPQTDPAKVRDGMCLRRMKAGSEWLTTGNTVGQASDVRHALAKQLYSALFAWLASTREPNPRARCPAASARARGRASPRVCVRASAGVDAERRADPRRVT